MGENLALPGREAIRTPMQWDAGAAGGFSTAPRDRLFRPVVTRGRFGAGTVNVRAQQRDPGSLLRWFEQLIRTLRECPEIGVGRARSSTPRCHVRCWPTASTHRREPCCCCTTCATNRSGYTSASWTKSPGNRSRFLRMALTSRRRHAWTTWSYAAGAIGGSGYAAARVPEAGVRSFGLVELAVITQLDERLRIPRQACSHQPRALTLGVELETQQDGDVRDPQPHQEDDHSGQRTVRLVYRPRSRCGDEHLVAIPANPARTPPAAHGELGESAGRRRDALTTTRPDSRPATRCRGIAFAPVTSLQSRSGISGPLGSKRIRAAILRAMKRAMKSAPLIRQINRGVERQLVKFPEFVGAPGRIRTCAPASGGRCSIP